jgi:hypothetical protein
MGGQPAPGDRQHCSRPVEVRATHAPAPPTTRGTRSPSQARGLGTAGHLAAPAGPRTAPDGNVASPDGRAVSRGRWNGLPCERGEQPRPRLGRPTSVHQALGLLPHPLNLRRDQFQSQGGGQVPSSRHCSRRPGMIPGRPTRSCRPRTAPRAYGDGPQRTQCSAT